jgi:hypothetical protein
MRRTAAEVYAGSFARRRQQIAWQPLCFYVAPTTVLGSARTAVALTSSRILVCFIVPEQRHASALRSMEQSLEQEKELRTARDFQR